ncbi:hypothetical protein NECID01_1207 [Nematocida sp. AWRm77]|nr:hypothetical protein NECID01_1207 [Nematocida sp. AWRm77]
MDRKILIRFVPHVKVFVQEAVQAHQETLAKRFADSTLSKSIRIKDAFEEILPTLTQSIGKYIEISGTNDLDLKQRIEADLLQDLYIINIMEYKDLKKALQDSSDNQTKAFAKFQKVVEFIISIKTSLYRTAYNLDRERSGRKNRIFYVEMLGEIFRCNRGYMLFDYDIAQLSSKAKEVLLDLLNILPYERIRTPSLQDMFQAIGGRDLKEFLAHIGQKISNSAISLDQKINELEVIKGLVHYKKELYNQKYNIHNWTEMSLQFLNLVDHKLLDQKHKDTAIEHLDWCLSQRYAEPTQEVADKYTEMAQCVKNLWQKIKAAQKARTKAVPPEAPSETLPSTQGLLNPENYVPAKQHAHDLSLNSLPLFHDAVRSVHAELFAEPVEASVQYMQSFISMSWHIREVCGAALIFSGVMYIVWWLRSIMEEEGILDFFMTIISLFDSVTHAKWMGIMFSGMVLIYTNPSSLISLAVPVTLTPNIYFLLIIGVSTVLSLVLWEALSSLFYLILLQLIVQCASGICVIIGAVSLVGKNKLLTMFNNPSLYWILSLSSFFAGLLGLLCTEPYNFAS